MEKLDNKLTKHTNHFKLHCGKNTNNRYFMFQFLPHTYTHIQRQSHTKTWSQDKHIYNYDIVI